MSLDIPDPACIGVAQASASRWRQAPSLLRARPVGAGHNRAPRRRKAFEITVTELRLIAAAASIGESSQPSHG